MLSDNLRCIAYNLSFVKQGEMTVRFNEKSSFTPDKGVS
jgi:hypothetical protein